jgi:hypothetical protein
MTEDSQSIYFARGHNVSGAGGATHYRSDAPATTLSCSQ